MKSMSRRVKVRRVVEHPKAGAPILLSFEHGGVNKDVDLNTRLVAGLYESNVAEEEKPSKERSWSPGHRKEVVVVQGETDMTYIGSSESFLNSNSHGLRTFLAVRHKGKLKVYESKPLTVSPYLGNRAHLKVSDAKKAEDADEKKLAAIDLVRAFGSKQKVLANERRELYQIDSADMNESISTAAERAEVPNVSPNTRDTSVLTLVPPCHREAKDIKSVYSVHDILSDEDLQGMEEMAHGWLNTSTDEVKLWKDSKQFSDYFFEMLRRLSAHKSDGESIYKAKLVLYTELLVALIKMKHNNFRPKVIPLPKEFPTWLVDKALAEFTVINANKIRCRSEAYKDKTCCYVMVLVLLANDFVFDVQLMSTSLQIHIKKLLTLTRAVGMSMSFNSSTKEHRGLLKLPLPKPLETRGRKRLRK